MSIADARPIEIAASDVEQLIDKAAQGALDPAEQRRLVPLLKTLLWLEHMLLSTRISLTKLKRMLFGHKTEKQSRHANNDTSGGGRTDAGDNPSPAQPPATDTPPSSSPAPVDTTDDTNPARSGGHGRRAAADYPGAEAVFCAHPTQQAGGRCQALPMRSAVPLGAAGATAF